MIMFCCGSNFATCNHSEQIIIFSITPALSTLVCIRIIISMFELWWVPNFIKIGANFIVGTNFTQVFNLGQDPPFSSIIFKINQLDLLWMSNIIALGIYFIFETKFSWNEEIDTCFNVEYVLLGRNFDCFGGSLVVTARYLVVITS